MELANSRRWRVRVAGQVDSREIGQLLGIATLRHLHLDWHLPVDWIGTPGFVLCEQQRKSGKPEIVACLAVGADPPPAAWVRVAAVKRSRVGEQYLQEMLGLTMSWLREQGTSVLAWLPESSWPEHWLTSLGFQKVNWIVTYCRDLSGATTLGEQFAELGPGRELVVRPATTDDTARLAEIELAAFDPIWRHSEQGLLAMFKEAISYDVAKIDGRIVGFQYSVGGQDGKSAHLVRLTVAPEAQGRGVGSGLLGTALLAFAERGAERITLNTQADNLASHRLYERFGFNRLNGQTAVWAMVIE